MVPSTSIKCLDRFRRPKQFIFQVEHPSERIFEYLGLNVNSGTLGLVHRVTWADFGRVLDAFSKCGSGSRRPN